MKITKAAISGITATGKRANDHRGLHKQKMQVKNKVLRSMARASRKINGR